MEWEITETISLAYLAELARGGEWHQRTAVVSHSLNISTAAGVHGIGAFFSHAKP